MAAKIDPEDTFDDMESEIIYTRGALEADPDARDLLASTDGWMPLVDEARARDRDARVAKVRADALRRVANLRLDASCESFGDELFLATGKDRKSARWVRFFAGALDTVNRFIRQPFGDQVAKVAAWLGVTGDDVLERHRADLEQWSTASSEAIRATAGTAIVRGQAQVARETAAESLTRVRDGLEAVLVQRAQDRGLPRSWPSVFFRTQYTRTKRAEPAPVEPPVSG